jgi:hypothetical protein
MCYNLNQCVVILIYIMYCIFNFYAIQPQVLSGGITHVETSRGV